MPSELAVDGVAPGTPDAPDPWSMFDRRAATGVAGGAEAVRVHVRFASARRIENLAVFGSANGVLSVSAERDGRLSPVSGLTEQDLSARSAGWNELRPDAPFESQHLVLSWRATQPGAALSEVRFWGSSPSRLPRPAEPLADQVIAGTADPTLRVAATPTEASIAPPDFARSNMAGTFTLRLETDPRSVARAFLVYELHGLGHWTNVRRRINRGEWLGGGPAPRVTSTGLQVEEIAVSALRRGHNTVDFEPIDATDPSGYQVRDLRVVAFAAEDDPTVAVDNASEALRAVADGDPTTATTSQRGRAGDGSVVWPLSGSRQVREIAFLLPEPARGTLEIAALAPGAAGVRQRIELDGRPAGWHRVRVDNALPATDALRVQVNSAAETPSRVAEIELSTTAGMLDADQTRIVVTHPLHGECVGDEVVIRGFVEPATRAGARPTLRVDGVEAPATGATDGAFALTVHAPAVARQGQAWQVALRAAYPDGLEIARTVSLEACRRMAPPPASNGPVAWVEDTGAPYGAWVRPDRPATIAFGDATLEVPAGAVERDTRITVRPLTTSQVASMDPGLTNVTPGGRAFRFGPHHLHFRRPVRLTLPVDATRLPPGTTELDVSTYYYDEPTRRWRSVRTLASASGGRLTSTTEHFTDFISGVLAMPDHPEASSFNPNAMSGLQLGQPAAGVSVIEPPSANSSGAAVTSYPIETPPGRAGLQPSLRIAYNSQHPNGMLGVGWNLELPSIEIDTRDGVPLYDEAQRPERYLLNGAMLTRDGPAEPGGDQRFRRRVEGAFERIVRHGATAAEYWWEVTDQSGTRYIYGRDARLTLNIGDGKIFRWCLDRVVDIFGNRMSFGYTVDRGATTGPGGAEGERWAQIYPTSIDYTAHDTGGTEDLAPRYHVQFSYDEARDDVLSNARAGFDVRTRKRLTAIEVKYDATIVRKYVLTYAAGEFGKSVLASIAVFSGAGREFYRHAFTYYNAGRDSSGNFAFEPARQWGLLPAEAAVGAQGASNGGGATGFIGIGVPWCDPHIGAGVAFAAHSSFTHHSFTDVNGDGLPDLVDDGRRVRLNGFATPARTSGRLTDDPLNTNTGEHSLTTSTEFAVSAGVHALGERASLTFDATFNWSHLYTLMTDVDGDGLVDIIRGPAREGSGSALNVFLNPWSPREISHGFGTAFGERTYALGGFSPYQYATRVRSEDADRLRAIMQPTSIVARWRARWPGSVRISGLVDRLGPTRGPDGTDGIRVSIYRVTGSTQTTVWQRTFAPGAAPCGPAPSNGCDPADSGIEIPSIVDGDRLYFQVEGLEDATGDQTRWDPVIQYTSAGPYCVPSGCVPPPSPLPSYSQSTDFRNVDQDTVGWIAPANGLVRVSGDLVRGSTAARYIATIYRRRRPATGWSDPPGTPLDSSAIAAMLAATSGTPIPLENLFSWTITASDPASVALNRTISVEEGDQLIMSVRPDTAGTEFDPRTETVDWYPEVRYARIERVDPRTNTAVFRDVASCDDESVPFGQCTMLAEPGDTGPVQMARALIVRRAVPAVAPSPPTAPPTTRDDRMVGWYNGWSYVEWIGSIPFSEATLASGDDVVEIGSQIDSVNTGAPPFLPRAIPMRPQRAGAECINQPPPPLEPTDPRTRTGVPPATCANVAWVGVGGDSEVRAGVWKPSHLGGFRVTSTNELEPVLERTRSVGNAPGLRAGDGFNAGAGASLIGASGGAQLGESYSRREFFDFNGDRMPDAIHGPETTAPGAPGGDYAGHVQFQRPNRAGFAAETTVPMTLGAIRQVNTRSVRGGFNIGSTVSQLVQKGATSGALADVLAMQPSFGITNSTSDTMASFEDINGDGLPDHVRIRRDGSDQLWLDVQLNLGHRLGATQSIAWTSSNGGFGGSDALETELTNGNSLQVGYAGIGGGPAYSHRVGTMRLVDLNGDGLPDRVSRAPGASELQVQFNLGTRFAPTMVWRTPAWPAATTFGSEHDALTYDSSFTFGAGAGLGGVGKIPAWFICLAFEISAQLNHSDNRGLLQLVDVDGDGMLDQVLKVGGDGPLPAALEPELYVRRNQTGRANLLATVQQPLGGSFTIDYTHEGNRVARVLEPELGPGVYANYVTPNHQWALSRVDANDGRGNHYVRTFEYFGSGNYDRIERESYGYARVRTTREDGSTVDEYFHNQDYYRRGLLFRAVEAAAPAMGSTTGLLYRMTETDYDAPSMMLADGTGSFFPAARAQRSYWYEGRTTSRAMYLRRATVTRDYDALGHVIAMTDTGEEGTTDDDVHYSVSYVAVDPARYIHRAEHVVATRAGGAVLRARTAHFRPVEATLEYVTETLIGGRDPVSGATYTGATNPRWDYEFDAYGALTQASDGTGFTTRYDYDGATHSHRTRIRQTSGFATDYESTAPEAMIDYRFGVPRETVDVNGHRQRLDLDEFGRVVAVRGPDDIAATEPTIAYDYSLATATPAPPVAWARTRHKDEARPGDPIVTVSFIDGLGRLIQTRRDAEVDSTGSGTSDIGCIVTGPVTFDARGRLERQGQPIFYRGPETDFVTVTETNPTRIAYDILGRTTEVVAPDGARTRTTYGAEMMLDGTTWLSTTVTDALSRVHTTYRDVRDRTVAVQQRNHIGGVLRHLETRYAYDPLGQLTRVIDAAGHVTTAEYDTRGHMVALENEDTGRTEYRYTVAGDLGARETPNLHGTGGLIRYARTHHRLDQVTYPDPTRKVTFTYGAPGAPANRAGRIAKITDESGSETRSYGSLGEVVRTDRTLVADGSAGALTATTEFDWDVFGRLRSIVYPDGETVAYMYDAGGQLTSARGTLGGTTTDYVRRITYDAFGQRAFIRYGNDVTTRYAYDARTRRLDLLHTISPTAGELQKTNYVFNLVGNVAEVRNTRALPASGIGGPTAFVFGYDELDQLTSATGLYTSTTGERRMTLAVSYDTIGNIVTNHQTDVFRPAGTMTDFPQPETSHDLAYVYGGSRPHAPTTVGPRAITYDDNGNQTGWSETVGGATTTRTIAWDDEDRVRRITTNGKAVYFRYDAAGQRTHRRSGASGVTQYLNQFYALRNGAIATKSVFAGEARVASVVSSATTGTQRFYYHSDHLSSTNAVTDEYGKLYEHLEYMPFGETWIEEHEGSERVPYRFTGHELDRDTGLYYAGARYYDPRQAQWVSADPILAAYVERSSNGESHDPAYWSSYAYARNSPVIVYDPDGREALIRSTEERSEDAATARAVASAAWSAFGSAGNFVGGVFMGLIPNSRRGAPVGDHAAAYAAGRVVGSAFGQAANQFLGMFGGGPPGPGRAMARGGVSVGPRSAPMPGVIPTEGYRDNLTRALNDLQNATAQPPRRWVDVITAPGPAGQSSAIGQAITGITAPGASFGDRVAQMGRYIGQLERAYNGVSGFGVQPGADGSMIYPTGTGLTVVLRPDGAVYIGRIQNPSHFQHTPRVGLLPNYGPGGLFRAAAAFVPSRTP